jgi:hypothetical protein
MNRNIQIKIGIIVVVVLVCLYGIIGVPKSKDELMANWKKNIHLGLDLSGGTQLVMQVQLQDAFKAFADNAIDRLKQELQKDNIPVSGDVLRNDPNSLEDADKIEIDFKGIPLAKTSAFRTTVSDQFPEWILTPINSTDYRMTMKPTDALKLKHGKLAIGLAALPLSTAQAQYYAPCWPSPLAWPFCVAGAIVGTAATIATAPFWLLAGAPYYGYYAPPYYAAPSYDPAGYYALSYAPPASAPEAAPGAPVPLAPPPPTAHPSKNSAPAQSAYYYFCPDSKGYYPYVARCAVAWRRVPATPPQRSESR